MFHYSKNLHRYLKFQIKENLLLESLLRSYQEHINIRNLPLRLMMELP
jgi:hypothetical protein